MEDLSIFKNELEEILKFSWEIQGQLNTINEALTKIGGNYLHNLDNKVYDIQARIEYMERQSQNHIKPKSVPCCLEDD